MSATKDVRRIVAVAGVAIVGLLSLPAMAGAAGSADRGSHPLSRMAGEGCMGEDCRAFKTQCRADRRVYRETIMPTQSGAIGVYGWCQPRPTRDLACVGAGSCALLKGFCIASGGSYSDFVVAGVTFGECELPPEPRSLHCSGISDCNALRELCIVAKGTYTETIRPLPDGGFIVTGSCTGATRA